MQGRKAAAVRLSHIFLCSIFNSLPEYVEFSTLRNLFLDPSSLYILTAFYLRSPSIEYSKVWASLLESPRHISVFSSAKSRSAPPTLSPHFIHKVIHHEVLSIFIMAPRGGEILCPSFRSNLYSVQPAARYVPFPSLTILTIDVNIGTCPADPALGKSITIDFTSGASNEFNAIGAPTYNSDGANLAVAQSGDSPTLTSKWYMQFGNVEVVMKPAPGVGIVSSMVLQSDDLDEIDFEWLGADGQQVQSNYFGKGQTLSYNRGAFHPNPGAHNY